MNQITKQIPALFKQTSKRIKRQKNITLTQAQVQSLVSLLKENIQFEQARRRGDLETASNYWENCNPDDPMTIGHFNFMNSIRNEARRHKEKIAKLSKLQNTLKKMR